MVKLLGHLGGKLNRNLVTGKEKEENSTLANRSDSSVSRLGVPFMAPVFSHQVVSSEEMMKKFVAWDSEKRLSFAVPFSDMKPVIYLDPFLPRISELALSTSDRQTKV